jgi:hypothetical protein
VRFKKQTMDCFYQGRLAGSVPAQQSHHFAFANAKADILNYVLIFPIARRQITYPQYDITIWKIYIHPAVTPLAAISVSSTNP